MVSLIKFFISFKCPQGDLSLLNLFSSHRYVIEIRFNPLIHFSGSTKVVLLGFDVNFFLKFVFKGLLSLILRDFINLCKLLGSSSTESLF